MAGPSTDPMASANEEVPTRTTVTVNGRAASEVGTATTSPKPTVLTVTTPK